VKHGRQWCWSVFDAFFGLFFVEFMVGGFGEHFVLFVGDDGAVGWLELVDGLVASLGVGLVGVTGTGLVVAGVGFL
jgi:hypothetical protein